MFDFNIKLPTKTSKLRLGTTIAYVKYDHKKIKNGGIVIAADSQATLGHSIWSSDTKKLAHLGQYTIAGWAGAANLAEATLSAARAQYHYNYYNTKKHLRNTIEGISGINSIEDIQHQLLSQIPAGYENYGIHSIIISKSDDKSLPKVSIFRSALWVTRNKSFGAIGSGSRYVRQYLSTRKTLALDAIAAEKMLISAISRSKSVDLYSGGPIMICHLNSDGRTAFKYVDISSSEKTKKI